MRICPGCRATYEDHVSTCPRDNLPLIVQSSTGPPGQAGRETVLAPGLMIGEYQIEGVLAEGSLGTIYSGIHPLIRKRVAIKVIKKHLAEDSSAVSRFVMEAYAVNEIGHYNIVDIFSIGELDDGRNYLIMELLEGLSLRQILQRERRLKPGEVQPVFDQLCDAIAAAHAKGYFHQDLKPENVFVLRRPPHPMIKVLDFGIAKLKSGPQVDLDAPTMVGTSAYVAPESFRGGEVDARVDIYAIGAILYELVTGRAPHSELESEHVVGAEPPRPSHFAAVGEQLERVILRAMAPDPADRFSTVRELRDEIRQAIPDLLPWTIRMDLTDQQKAESIADTVARKVPIARPPAPVQPTSSGLVPETIAGEVPEDELETQHGSIKMRRWMKEHGGSARDASSPGEHAAGDDPAILSPVTLPGVFADEELHDLPRDTDPAARPPVHLHAEEADRQDDRTISDIHPPTVDQLLEDEPPTATVRTEGPQMELTEEDADQTIAEPKPEVILDARQALGAAADDLDVLDDLDETDDDAPTATVRTGPAEMPAVAEAEDQTIAEPKPEVILDARQVLGAEADDLDDLDDLDETDDDAPTATVKTRPAGILAGDLAEETVPAPEVVVDVRKLQGEEEEEAPTTVRGEGQAVVMGDLDLEGGYEEPDATKPYGPEGAAAYHQRESTKPYGHKKRALVDDEKEALAPEPAVEPRPGTLDVDGPTDVADALPSDELPTMVAQSGSNSMEQPTRISDLRAKVAELAKPANPPVLGTTSGMHQAVEEVLDSIDDLFEQVDGQPLEPATQEREVTKPDRPSVKGASASPAPPVVGRVKLVKRSAQDQGPLIPPRTLMGIGPGELEAEEGKPQEEEEEFDLELAQTAPLDVVDWGSAGEIQSPAEEEPYASIEIITEDDE